ncbi:flagellar C1a complex subunit C1a-32-domain-containing protein [Zopfochytrium polystomum]|nr:flagellar C1a complex subunit C1a-32-domain-containing protein [Zopfochytrium polystomum]
MLPLKDLSKKEVYDFYALSSPDEGLRFASNLVKSEDDPEKHAILADFYFYCLCFARDSKFSPDKASSFFAIMKETHRHAMSTPFINLDKDYGFFKDLLLRHSIYRPPFSEKVFQFAEMKAITEYAVNTYFRHYMMYKYVFTKKVKIEFTIENADLTPSSSAEDIAAAAAAAGTATAGTGTAAATSLPLPAEGHATAAAAAVVAVDAVGGEPAARALESEVGAATDVATTGDAAAAADGASGDGGGAQGAEAAAGATGAADATPGATGAEATAADPSGLQTQLAHSSTSAGEGEAGGAGEHAALSKHDQAVADLRNLVIASIAPKLEEMKLSFTQKMAAQEDQFAARMKKLELEESKLLSTSKDKKEVKPKGKK